jgi:hypothetical protein
LQACRGNQFDEGQEVTVADAKGEEEDMDEDVEVTVHRIPSEADFLIAYSVVPGSSRRTDLLFDYVRPVNLLS